MRFEAGAGEGAPYASPWLRYEPGASSVSPRAVVARLLAAEPGATGAVSSMGAAPLAVDCLVLESLALCWGEARSEGVRAL